MPRPPAADDLPPVSRAEWEVAEAIWAAGRPVSSTDIVARLGSGRHPKTVRTLLGRLVQKGVAVAERRGRTSYYFARLSRTEYVERETAALLHRIFAGDRAALMHHLLRDGGDLSPVDLAGLRYRLSELESPHGSQPGPARAAARPDSR